MEKCVIFGIDGADFYLTRQLMDEGELPNLKALAEHGSYNPLLSTIPPLTPQAWSSFACGVNPGKHGIFDFGEFCSLLILSHLHEYGLDLKMKALPQ